LKIKEDFYSGPGMEKPGSLYGKGKPFGNKKKPPSKSSKGKSGNKDKRLSNTSIGVCSNASSSLLRPGLHLAYTHRRKVE